MSKFKRMGFGWYADFIMFLLITGAVLFGGIYDTVDFYLQGAYGAAAFICVLCLIALLSCGSIINELVNEALNNGKEN